MSPTWDTFIILFFVVMTVYGMLLGRGRVFNILINTYVGYVVAGELGALSYSYLVKVNELAHSIQISVFGAKILTFALVIFILTLNAELSGAQDDTLSSPPYTAAYGFLCAGLILTAVMSFMAETDRFNLFSVSNLATKVYDYRVIWLVAPILVVTFGTIMKRFVRRK